MAEPPLPGSRWINQTAHTTVTATVVRVTKGGKVIFEQGQRASKKTGRGHSHTRRHVALEAFLRIYRPR